jgi:hypothetical protein
MNTTSSKPDSVSMVNITPAAPKSERTIRCTPADKATSAWAKPFANAVADQLGRCRAKQTLLSFCAALSSMPITFKKVSCWPANEASGKSSAVAEERTAKNAPLHPSNTRSATIIGIVGAGGIGLHLSEMIPCAQLRQAAFIIPLFFAVAVIDAIAPHPPVIAVPLTVRPPEQCHSAARSAP